jgi:hypothetical protein
MKNKIFKLQHIYVVVIYTWMRERILGLEKIPKKVSRFIEKCKSHQHCFYLRCTWINITNSSETLRIIRTRRFDGSQTNSTHYLCIAVYNRSAYSITYRYARVTRIDDCYYYTYIDRKRDYYFIIYFFIYFHFAAIGRRVVKRTVKPLCTATARVPSTQYACRTICITILEIRFRSVIVLNNVPNVSKDLL